VSRQTRTARASHAVRRPRSTPSRKGRWRSISAICCGRLGRPWCGPSCRRLAWRQSTIARYPLTGPRRSEESSPIPRISRHGYLMTFARPWARRGSGCLSPTARPPRHLGGLAGPRAASNPTDVAVYPQQIPATTIDDHANQITAISAAMPEALALTYTRGDGLTVQALTAHLKSKLLAFSSRDPQQPPLRLARRGRTLRPRGRSARHQRLELGRGRQARFTMKEVAVGIELP
jgi:hypothetical protein